MYTVKATMPNGTQFTSTGTFQECVEWADSMKELYHITTINIEEVKE